MNLIQFNIQGALAGTTQFDPDSPGVVRTVADSRIIFDTAPPLSFGRFDVADLLGLAGRPMVVFSITISNALAGVTGNFGTAGPTAPGSTARGTDLDALAVLPPFGNAFIQTPVIVPSGHLLQVNSDGPPITLLLLVGQYKSGNIANELVRGSLTT